jgi:ABC-type transport system substrate-binding protein
MNNLKLICLFFLLLFNYCSKSSKVSYGIEIFPTNLDPSFGLSFDESQISSQIYENLISLDNDCATLNPRLAVSWNVSKDKCTYTFVLRNNVFFHDGTKLSSYSIQSTYEWLCNKQNRSEIFDKIKNINIIDSLSFEFVLYEPFSIFLYVLASPESFQVMSEHAIAKYDTLIGRHPVGTGPFYLNKWVDGEKIILNKFKKYWGEHGNLNEIVFKYYKNIFQGEDYLEKNTIDILYSATSYSIDRLKWTGFIDYHIFVPDDIQFIGFNNEAYPFNDKYFRKAILKAINIPRFVHSSTRGKAIVAKGPLPPNYYDYNDTVQDSYNIDEAKSILNELGFASLDITFDFPKIAFKRITKIEFLKHELNKVGIHLKVRAHDTWEELDKAIASDSAQMFYNGGRSDIIGDPFNFLWGFFYSKSEFNTLKYKESKIDQWIDEAIQENNPQKRQSLYRKIVSKILDDTPAIFLFHIIPSLAYNTKKIRILITNPYGTVQFNKIELN